MSKDNNYESLVNFDRDDKSSVFSRAMDIAAMGLDADELDDHLASIGVTRDELELIGADCLLDDSSDSDDSFDSWDDSGEEDW